MKRLLAVVAVVGLSGCDFLPGGGGGTGGGGGGGEVTFTKGFVFIRRDDKNVYLSDESNFMGSKALSTEGGAKHPSLTKDGKEVVFVKVESSDSKIMTVSVAGGMVKEVLSASSTGTAHNLRNPVYSPDGTRIYFAYDDGASSSIGVVNVDGSGFRRLAGGGPTAYSGISVFADGSGLLAASGSSTSQLLQIEKVSTVNGQATPVASSLGDATGIASRVVVSPDGKLAAFDGRLGSGSTRIFVIDLTSKAVHQLTDYPGEPGANDSLPCWYGNDQVCFSSDTGGNDSVYALPATGMMTSGGLKLPGGTEPWYGPN